MQYNYINELKAIHENTPWYYRFTRSIFGFNQALKNGEGIMARAYRKAGQSTILVAMREHEHLLANSYNSFTRKIMGLDQLDKQYSALAERAEQEQLHAINKIESNDVLNDINALKHDKLVSQQIKLHEKSSHSLLMEKLDAQAHLIRNIKTPKPEMNSNGQPKTYGNLKRELKTSIKDLEEQNQRHNNYFYDTAEWKSSNAAIDRIYGVINSAKISLQLLFAHSPRVEIISNKPEVIYPVLRK